MGDKEGNSQAVAKSSAGCTTTLVLSLITTTEKALEPTFQYQTSPKLGLRGALCYTQAQIY